MDKLIFTQSPAVTIATNTFINVPVILQYEDTPLISIVQAQPAGYTTQIPIYHPDGTYLAKAVGSRLFPTPAGEKAGLKLEHPPKMTVCKLGDRTLFEIIREEAAALKTRAELHAPDGYFVKVTDDPKVGLFTAAGNALQVGGLTMIGCMVQSRRIGIWIKKDGSVAVAVS
jgi:hypothetical protein